MIISTTKEKPITIFFLIFNFVTFWIFKILLLNNIVIQKQIIFIYIITVALGLVTSLIYSVINIYFTYNIVRKVMNKSKYITKYDCNLFSEYSIPYILKLKKDICSIYVNEKKLSSMQSSSEIFEYVFELRSKLFMLNSRDILCIYFYKYINLVFNSILIFIILQICVISSIKNGAIIQIVIVTCVYFIFNKFLLNLTNKYMKKRNLDIFIAK